MSLSPSVPGHDAATLPETILIVDDERNFRGFLAEALVAEGFQVQQAATAEVGIALARSAPPDIVLLDQDLPGRSGLDALRDFLALPGAPTVIMITAYASYPSAIEAIKAGAFSYCPKPFEFGELLATLSQALERRVGVGAGAQAACLTAIMGRSPAMTTLREKVARVAVSPVETVLLEGESGTGKELVARAIHDASVRSARPFQAVNCAALTETLLMSELFGHEAGAFTGARGRRIGFFEAAEGGTIFLDEITEMALPAQAALLRVLEERVITRVGGTEAILVNVRVIAATNRPLRALMEKGEFRGDLYYRLNVARLEIPPLRERPQDVTVLARHFAERFAERYGREHRHLSQDALACLQSYDWPGNVRELRNAIEHAFALGSGPVIDADALPAEIRPSATVPAGDMTAWTGDDFLPFHHVKESVITDFERRYLTQALEHADGNVTQAAELSGMLRQAFQRLLKRHNIRAREFRVS